MFDLEKRTIELAGRPIPIREFQVWWCIPTIGLIPILEDAIKRCKENDWDVASCCIPTVVAIGQDGVYEVLR